ncbi:MAG: hypothetical protein R3C05_13090 [Pirellulaceae bacterium]
MASRYSYSQDNLFSLSRHLQRDDLANIVQTAAAGPAGQLPLTDEMLRMEQRRSVWLDAECRDGLQDPHA